MSSTSLFRFPDTSRKQTWSQLHGASLPLAIAQWHQNNPGITLLIAPDNLTALQLLADLPFFMGNSSPELLFFPDWETLPYDQFSPHQDIISERLTTLSRLQQSTHAIVITAISTVMHRICPPEFLNQHTFILNTGQTLDRDGCRLALEQAGYRCVNSVMEHGEFSSRGSILDIYPMGSLLPFRIELLDDTIESLRFFDPDTQRTVRKTQSVHILPAREFPLNEPAITQFRRSFREHFPGNPALCPLYEGVTQGNCPSGIEYYLPLFFTQTVDFFSYLPQTATVFCLEDLPGQADVFWKEINVRYEQRCHDVTRPLLAPSAAFIAPPDLFNAVNRFTQRRVYANPIERKGQSFQFPTQKAPMLPLTRQSAAPLAQLRDYVNTPHQRTLIVVESTGRREVTLELLKHSGIACKTQNSWADFLADISAVNITTGPLIEGTVLADARLAIVVEAQWLGETRVPQRRTIQKSVDPDTVVRDLAELTLDSPVVHLDFGVGRYKGLQTFENQGNFDEFLVIAYARGDKIYVPVTALHQISRYTGLDSEHAPLHQLGTDRWQKDKKKAIEKINDTAVELLEIYAKREAKPGFTHVFQTEDYQRFASAFPFEETLDQTTAIKAIIKDMQSPRPMDRLICGDVGFGKTEVAMRAAFLAVHNARQVCVLVPTTLLAGQHFETFRDRFVDFPLRIELLSRFRSAKETTAVIKDLANGKIDIVIGTHKLFSKAIVFHQLGLLIIDEEHRFGVKQKEQIKALRTEVDILSMTATPIPRTLNMAMAGIRDISLITTPPAKRLAIKTFWNEKTDNLLREALLREILRGGQVFFLHNNVETIERVCQEIQTLVPEAKARVAHGQLRERELEKIMADFYHHRFNVLVCTTIIETGIDIPTANTIVIDRADKLGLAQLHQLRGRVGRSHHQAYAYLLTPTEKTLSKDAIKRLEAIVSLEDLGAGFTLATHDLEIRGAGELLGEEQSGNMQAIGFTLFMELLDRAVSDLKAGKTPELSLPKHHGCEIDLRISTIIPADYIPDVHTRLIVYKRLANAKTREALRDLQIECIDRFGLIPQSTRQLFWITELKLLATSLGITKIMLTQDTVRLEFNKEATINPGVLIALVQTQSTRYQFNGPQGLRVTLQQREPEKRIDEIKALLVQLST